MLSLDSTFIFLRTSKFFCLFGLFCFLQLSGLPLEVNAATNKEPTINKETPISLYESLKSKPWSNIQGFRSAKFGMDEKKIFRAISKDFKISKSKVKRVINPTEKTTTLQITVPELFSTGGTAQVGYVLGYKSKKLITVNVLWGKGATEDVDGQSVLDTANQLRTHFLKKRYQKEMLMANGKISDNQTLVFRGFDEKKRMVAVVLTTGTVPEGGNTVESLKNMSLLVSYIKDMANPDVRVISIKDDEF